MNNTVAWIQVGDLHMDADSDWISLSRLQSIVDEANLHLEHGVDFLFLPGDNANHGTADQYAAVNRALQPLRLPWYVIPGDHDFEPGDLSAYEAAFGAERRPEAKVIGSHRCIFLDFVSGGAGGPDFRLVMHHRNRLARELALAEAHGQVPLVFMHAYPCDLAADGEEIAQMLADAQVAFVSTGHTHYNELLNDGRVIYGATRSTGEIEEDGGRPGFSLVCVHRTVPSWRFKHIGSAWPFVQIVSPCDVRLVTRPADPLQVPRPGSVEVTVKLFGRGQENVLLTLDDGPSAPMYQGERGLWTAAVEMREQGLHRLTASCGAARDVVDVLVRNADSIPKRRLPVALGHSCHAIGTWPQAGLEGTQLGPNRNGKDW